MKKKKKKKKEKKKRKKKKKKKKEKKKKKTEETKKKKNVSHIRHRGLSIVGASTLDALRGYMMKKAKTISQWRRRWFAIKRVYDPKLKQWCLSLCWHEDHNSPVRRSVPIEMLSEVAKTDQKLTFKIVIISPDGSKKRVILLKAENEEQQELWVTSLSKMVNDIQTRLKHAFLNEESIPRNLIVSSNISFGVTSSDDIQNADTESPLKKENVYKRTASFEQLKLRGKSKRTSTFAMPAKRETANISPMSAGRERPMVLSLVSLQDEDFENLDDNNNKEQKCNFGEKDNLDAETASVPASQGCGCVIA